LDDDLCFVQTRSFRRIGRDPVERVAVAQRSVPSGNATVVVTPEGRVMLLAMGDYRKLEVWKLAVSVSDRVYVLAERIGRRDRAGLCDQLVRAAESIHLNIAEGCGLNSDAQLARHTRIALGSSNELEDGLATLQRRRLLPQDDEVLLSDASILRRMLGRLLRTLNEAKSQR
jgi:four helix bundle protein